MAARHLRNLSDCGPHLASIVASLLHVREIGSTNLSLCPFRAVQLPNIPYNRGIRSKNLVTYTSYCFPSFVPCFPAQGQTPELQHSQKPGKRVGDLGIGPKILAWSHDQRSDYYTIPMPDPGPVFLPPSPYWSFWGRETSYQSPSQPVF